MIIAHLIPTLEGGGAERQLSLLAGELAARKITVHVIARRGGIFLADLQSSGCVVHILGDHRNQNLRLLWNVARLLDKIRPDILQTWLPQMDVIGGVVAIGKRIPWVISERSSREAYSNFSVRTLTRKYVSRFCSAIVANSEGGRQYWLDELGLDPRLVKIGNSVDSKVCGDKHKSLLGPNENAGATLLVVGRLIESKALDVIVQAVRLMPRFVPFQILIIGDGPLRVSLINDIVASGISDVCTVLEYTADWWKFLPFSSALISMSRYEGHPNVLLEAVIAGVPIVASDIPAHREFLNLSTSLLVPIDNSVVLAEAVTSVLLNREAAKFRAKRAFDDLAAKVTVRAMVDSYVALFNKIINRTVR